MTDRQLRHYQRDSSCPQARAAYAAALLRSGGVNARRMRLHAHLGDPAAQQATGMDPPLELFAWALGLRLWGRRVRFAAAFAAVTCVARRHAAAAEAEARAAGLPRRVDPVSAALELVVRFVEWHGEDDVRLAKAVWPAPWIGYYQGDRVLVRDLATFLRKSTRSARAAAKCLARACESPHVDAATIRCAVVTALRTQFPLGVKESLETGQGAALPRRRVPLTAGNLVVPQCLR